MNFESEFIPLQLMNVSDSYHRIKKGTKLAICEPVCGVSISEVRDGLGNIKRTQAGTKLPDHVRELEKYVM